MKSDNSSGQYDAEIQSSVASKLFLFLTDTLGPVIDSVETLLNENHGSMEDADVQIVFMNILKGDLAQATNKANELQSTKPNWKALLNKIIELESDTLAGIFLLNTDSGKRNYILNHAATENIDGQSVALALLKATCDSSYTEPHAIPVEEAEERSAHTNNEEINDLNGNLSAEAQGLIHIYPNPTDKSFNLYADFIFKSKIEFELLDLFGRILLSGSLTPGIVQNLNSDNLSSGVYIINFLQKTHIIAKQKLILLK